MTNFCEKPCDECPVAAIEDPAKRVMVAEQVGRTLRAYQHQELRSASDEGQTRLIEAANSSWDEDAEEHIVDSALDINLVRPAVVRIAREECPEHRDAWFISGLKKGE